MRLVPHVHKFEPADKVFGPDPGYKGIPWPKHLCSCGRYAFTEVEVMNLEHESIIWRASVLCMWAMGLGMFIVGLIMLYRWSFEL